MLTPMRISAILIVLVLVAAGCGSIGSLTGLPSGVSEHAPPSVTSVLPAADGTAPSDSPITVTFSKPMSPGGFEITTEPPLVFGNAQWSEDTRTVTVRPTGPLTAGIIYTVRVRARDRQGNPLPADHVWSFTATAPSEVRGEGRLRLAERIDVGMDARVFALFAAFIAAAADAAGGEPGSVRAVVRARMADLPARAADPVRRYFADQPAPVEEYVAAALALSAPPEFREAGASRTGGSPAPQPAAPQQAPPQQAAQQQPGPQRSPTPRPTPTAPGAGGVTNLGPVLAQFYAAANLDDLWRSSGKAYAEALETYRKDAPAILGRAADYMRAPAIPGGRIVLLPNLLGRPGQGHLIRQSGRVVFVVSAAPAVDRLALVRPFVRLVLDPVRGTAIEATRRAEPLFPQVREVAARAGFRTWPEIVVESMIEATAIRLALAGDEAHAALRAAYARGLVLVDHFSAQLSEYERTTATLVDFYPTMVAAVDVGLELRRWAERRPN